MPYPPAKTSIVGLMEESMGRFIFCAAMVLAGACLTHSAAAQKNDWPTRPVRFVVPFPPGGTVDPLARLLSARLSPSLGHQFVVDNRSGASGSLGTGIAAKANPDGYTFIFVFYMNGTNPLMIPTLPYAQPNDRTPT